MEKYIGKYSVKDFLYLILGAFIYSIGTHSFIETANIAPGGAVGVALMLNHVTNLPVGRLTLMVNVPLLILAWFHLSRAFALRTAFACGICSVVLDYVIAPVFPVYMGDQLMEVSTAAFWSASAWRSSFCPVRRRAAAMWSATCSRRNIRMSRSGAP